LVELVAIFGGGDGLGLSAHDAHPFPSQTGSQVDGRLTSELDHDAHRLLMSGDVEHVVERHGLKVEAVARVEVGADRFGVVVDDDRPIAEFAERPNAMNAGVIELDALPDTNRTRSQHEHGLSHRGYIVAPCGTAATGLSR